MIAMIKDIVIISGLRALYVVVKKVEIKPTTFGKASTALQMITVLLMLLQGVGFKIQTLLFIVMIITALVLFYSACTYVIIGIRIYRESK